MPLEEEDHQQLSCSQFQKSHFGNQDLMSTEEHAKVSTFLPVQVQQRH